MRKTSGFTLIELMITIVIIAIIATIAISAFYPAMGDSARYPEQQDYSVVTPVPTPKNYLVCMDGTPMVTTFRVRIADNSDWSLENGSIIFTDSTGKVRSVKQGTQTCKIQTE